MKDHVIHKFLEFRFLFFDLDQNLNLEQFESGSKTKFKQLEVTWSWILERNFDVPKSKRYALVTNFEVDQKVDPM